MTTVNEPTNTAAPPVGNGAVPSTATPLLEAVNLCIRFG
ncbi:MAG: hypothetical protein QOE15_870, partial [Acidimicrobiaceae bacterium]|nr:hypothetical protein [Acidimicrobiaceae bacterium]